jgi:guanosine-3',5'-bis(diphosphate) 3'-pyrophosphohydrolase
MRFLKKRNFVRFTDIKEEVASYLPNADFSLLEKAYVFSAKVHKGQTRLSGEPYLIHPLEVAMILAKLRMDLPTVSAGLLHDVLEDTLTSFGELKELFGEEIANLVDGVTKISKLPLTDPKVSQAETYRKMIMAMAKDIRVILIKLADRLHNVRTLEYHEEEKRKLIAKETIEIYAPIAHRLGIEWMKNELENLAFQHLDPVAYNEIYRKLRRFEKEKQKYIEEVKEILKKILKENGIEAEIQGRIKEPYSVYEKMKRLGIDFEQVYDLLAFRVIVNTEQECYQALGIIHSLWTPVPGRFKDYIALPKPNFYQSLHTTVIGPYGERMEVQIRTWEMHKVAEDGIAAHWKYKTGKGLGEEEVKKIGWLRQILELQRELEDPKEFLHILKIDLYPDEVYVFTPKGEVKVLPKGATPIDFAYSIHTDIGNHCYGARVNGKLVPLDYELKSGEIVEILTSPKAHPNRDWLKFAKTSRARAKILKFLREQEKKHAIILGQELCEKELKKVGLSLSEFQKKEEFKNLLESFNFKSSDDLFAAIGFGKITVSQVVDKIAPQETPVKKSESKRIKLDNLIKINGMENLLVYFAKCCNPLPGDEVVGFITRGHGISIHTSDCPNVLSIPPERYVEVEWKGENGFLFPVKIKVQAEDRKGLLAALSNSISQMGINILKAYVNTTKTGEALNFFEVEISNTKQLEKLLSHLRKVKGVKRVERVKKWV